MVYCPNVNHINLANTQLKYYIEFGVCSLLKNRLFKVLNFNPFSDGMYGCGDSDDDDDVKTGEVATKGNKGGGDEVEAVEVNDDGEFVLETKFSSDETIIGT